MKLWQGAALAALFVLLSGSIFLLSRPPVGEAIVLLPPPTESLFVVDISGAVASPGLYTLPKNCRLFQAVEAAGGLLDTADRERLNLASQLVDGSKVYVPFQNDEGSTSFAEPFDVPEKSAGQPSFMPGSGLININTASQAELETLPSIGPSTASKIIDYRQEHGPFQNIDALLDVPGIGPVTLDKIRDLISLVD
ncbi:MAG: ComEA family DNA-binding protein [Chloroflexi bacterium]|nr:MAG: ComEA family DNA-binding protein [Chloroflexota bacterium]